jgi:3D (Asp-Asp-Asp) domain-containing protein/peptidoglycan hydrolase CwlO-like protein
VLVGISMAAIIVLTLPPASGARRAPTVDRLRAEDADLAARARSAVLGLYALDARLGAARAQLGALEGRQERLRAERSSIDLQLRLARLDSRLSLDRVASRLRYLYDYGTTTSSLDVIMGSASLSQALSRLDDVNEVASANQSVIVQLHSAKGRLSWLSRVLTARERQLAQTTSSVAVTVAGLGQAEAERSAYISQLQRRQAYNAQDIARLTAEAQAAEQRSQALARERAREAATRVQIAAPAHLSFAPAASLTDRFTLDESSPAPSVAPPLAAGQQTITVVATGYDLGGTTSTGLPVGYGVAAVDPSVIPLGTRMTIPGYGEAVAADTGGAIVGTRIDLWFPSAAAALAWGVRTVTIAVSDE